MPRNPAKRRCVYPGCRAWARRVCDADRDPAGLCSSHARARALQAGGELVLPLLRAVTEIGPTAPSGTRPHQRAWLAGHAAPAPPALDDDLGLIDEELRRLFEARAQFLAWVEQARQEGDDGARVTPTSFLRAWNDSTTRVIQLLRARRDLTGSARGEDSLFDAVYDALEAMLPQVEDADTLPQVQDQGAATEENAQPAGGLEP
jgi:hypothetical protein